METLMQGWKERLKAMAKPELPGYIVLGRLKGENSYTGTIEGSFSMGVSKERTQFYWSSDNATSNFGGKFMVDGKVRSEQWSEKLAKSYPGSTWQIFDVHAESLPVLIDWDHWRMCCAPSEKTLSGVVDKFGARNVRFVEIED